MIMFDFRLDDEEVLSHFASFLKTLSLRLNPNTVQVRRDSSFSCIVGASCRWSLACDIGFVWDATARTDRILSWRRGEFRACGISRGPTDPFRRLSWPRSMPLGWQTLGGIEMEQKRRCTLDPFPVHQTCTPSLSILVQHAVESIACEILPMRFFTPSHMIGLGW